MGVIFLQILLLFTLLHSLI